MGNIAVTITSREEILCYLKGTCCGPSSYRLTNKFMFWYVCGYMSNSERSGFDWIRSGYNRCCTICSTGHIMAPLLSVFIVSLHPCVDGL